MSQEYLWKVCKEWSKDNPTLERIDVVSRGPRQVRVRRCAATGERCRFGVDELKTHFATTQPLAWARYIQDLDKQIRALETEKADLLALRHKAQEALDELQRDS